MQSKDARKKNPPKNEKKKIVCVCVCVREREREREREITFFVGKIMHRMRQNDIFIVKEFE